jgi:hypothetical protein
VVILDEVNGFATVGGLYRSADLEQLPALLEGTTAQVVAVAVEEIEGIVEWPCVRPSWLGPN